MRDAEVVTKKGTKEKIESVTSGVKPVSPVAHDVRERRKTSKYAEKPELNRTIDTAIKWAKYTWNPVTGCKKGKLKFVNQ